MEKSQHYLIFLGKRHEIVHEGRIFRPESKPYKYFNSTARGIKKLKLKLIKASKLKRDFMENLKEDQEEVLA
jgi:hypothetical protein